jgi:hypothetical protein
LPFRDNLSVAWLVRPNNKPRCPITERRDPVELEIENEERTTMGISRQRTDCVESDLARAWCV